MADWCRYLQGSSNYWCERTNEYPSYSVINYYCKNGGYGCSHYHISTFVGFILKKPFDDKPLNNIRKLRNKLDRNEEYDNFIYMYDKMGPILVEKINNDNDKIELSKKLYTVIDRISTFIDNDKEDRAIHYYCNMVGSLVNRYALGKLCNSEADYWNKTNKGAKKVPKLTKTIEK